MGPGGQFAVGPLRPLSTELPEPRLRVSCGCVIAGYAVQRPFGVAPSSGGHVDRVRGRSHRGPAPQCAGQPSVSSTPTSKWAPNRRPARSRAPSSDIGAISRPSPSTTANRNPASASTSSNRLRVRERCPVSSAAMVAGANPIAVPSCRWLRSCSRRTLRRYPGIDGNTRDLSSRAVGWHSSTPGTSNSDMLGPPLRSVDDAARHRQPPRPTATTQRGSLQCRHAAGRFRRRPDQGVRDAEALLTPCEQRLIQTRPHLRTLRRCSLSVSSDP